MKHFKTAVMSQTNKYKHPIAAVIWNACSRLETVCNLLENGTDAPVTMDFMICRAFEGLNEAAQELYGKDHGLRRTWKGEGE